MSGPLILLQKIFLLTLRTYKNDTLNALLDVDIGFKVACTVIFAIYTPFSISVALTLLKILFHSNWCEYLLVVIYTLWALPLKFSVPWRHWKFVVVMEHISKCAKIWIEAEEAIFLVLALFSRQLVWPIPCRAHVSRNRSEMYNCTCVIGVN